MYNELYDQYCRVTLHTHIERLHHGCTPRGGKAGCYTVELACVLLHVCV